MSSLPPPDRGIVAAVAAIDAATDETLLRTGIDHARAAIAEDLRARRPSLELASAWSDALRHGVAAGVRLRAPDAEWTWFASGSVARGEAAFGSDVETMVVLGDSVDADTKIELLACAADVHALLERCGVRGDANGVLASRPRFSRRAASWTEGIARWTSDPREDRGVVMTGLVADAGAVPGGAVAEDLLRKQVLDAAERSYPVRQAMLQDATAQRASVPSRLRLFATTDDTVDVKLAASDPVVKIARWAALSARSSSSSTPGRLHDAAAANLLEADDATCLDECFAWLTQFRWRRRAPTFSGGAPVGPQMNDVVSLSDLSPHERATLRSVAREVTGISRKLAYLASTSAFR